MFGLNAFKEHAVPANTEVEVVAAVEHAIVVHGHGYHGAGWVLGFATVYAGPDLAEGSCRRGARRSQGPRDNLTSLSSSSETRPDRR